MARQQMCFELSLFLYTYLYGCILFYMYCISFRFNVYVYISVPIYVLSWLWILVLIAVFFVSNLMYCFFMLCQKWRNKQVIYIYIYIIYLYKNKNCDWIWFHMGLFCCSQWQFVGLFVWENFTRETDVPSRLLYIFSPSLICTFGSLWQI